MTTSNALKQLQNRQTYYERLIKLGHADLEDYEAYVRCQRDIILLKREVKPRLNIPKTMLSNFLTAF